MNKEWYNSLYHFNKNSSKLFPAIYDHTFKLFNWYFNMTHDSINKKMKLHNKNNPRFTGHKFWISNPEIKHYNDNINITLYIYNNIYNYYKKKLELFQFGWGPIMLVKADENEREYFINKNMSEFRLFKRKFSTYLGTNKSVCDNNDFYKHVIKWLKLNKYIHMSKYRSDFLNNIKGNEIKLTNYVNNLQIKNYNYLINQFYKHLLYFKYKQKMLFNEFKYNEIYLPIVTKFLESMYNKRIKVNIISLKHFWLSTSILLQILTTKIQNPRNRGKYYLFLNSAISEIEVPILGKNNFARVIKPYLGAQNVRLDKFNSNEKDGINKFLISNIRSKVWSDKNIDGLILSNLENKVIAGIYLKISGRLTKRFKAQKAIHRLKFKGTLKNVYSAHKNYSSSLSRGYNNINVEKATINSKVRIGTFGLTGWVASY